MHRREHRKSLPILHRVCHEILVSGLLISLVLSELPHVLLVPETTEDGPQRSCCASSSASSKTTLTQCGCSLEKRQSGTCCCSGQSRCGRSDSSAEQEAFFHSCNCSTENGKIISHVAPRYLEPAKGFSEFQHITRHVPLIISLMVQFADTPPSPPPQFPIAGQV